MARFFGRNWGCLILTVYLVLAVMGTFTFSMDNTFHFKKSDGNLPGSSVFFTPINHTIDCLAEDTVTIGKINRTGGSRYSGDVTMPVGIHTGACLTGSSPQAANNYHVPILKNTIQLNLRI